MCHERERLIEFVYDECDTDERGRVNAHLATCATCREEIAGLRATRQDLLAWEVPDHGSVWRPFAPARLTPWWREVPAWAMAAAAGIMFLIGVSGGVAAQVLTARPAAAPATAPETALLTPVSVGAETAALRAELAALEQKLTLARQEDISRLDQRVQVLSTRGMTSPGLVRASDTGDHLALYSSVVTDFQGLLNRIKRLERAQNQLEQLLAAQPGAPGR